MYYNRGIRRTALRALVALMSVALVFTMMPLSGAGTVHAAGSLQIQSPVLAVTGTGLLQGGSYTKDNVSAERSYSLDDLKAMAESKEITYSAKKQREPFTKSYHKAKGVRLDVLLPDLSTRTDRISVIASDGYVSTFQKGGTYNNVAENVSGQGSISKDMDYSKLSEITPAPGFDKTRYCYEDFDASKGTEVPALLAWNYAESSDIPQSAGTSDANLKLFVGQLGGKGYDGPEDMNGPLLNGGSSAAVRQILAGDHISETALTVGTNQYTRADLLMMDFAEASYTYSTSGGEATDYVRGVPMSVLLEGYSDSDIVSFETADGYPVAANEYTVKQLIDNDYMMGYEKGESPAEMAAVFDQAKNDESIYGFFRLYGNDENGKPSKLITRMTVFSSSGIDFSTSQYKHVTNGGITGQSGPYNIDAITGATLTVEGPGTVSSTPLSVKDMENKNAGCYRGDYTDVRGGKEVARTYEGVELYYLLHNMTTGDNGIKLTDDAYKVQIKNRNRQTIAELTLDQIEKMHADGRPAIVAYGTSYTDGTNIRPFVFDGGAGADSGDLGNEDGCVKFVYDWKTYGGNDSYRTFGNMAYIYVELETAPGFKHDKAPYDTPENSQYILTVTGDKIGKEINYKVSDLENLVKYNDDGTVDTSNGYGWRDEYSLANSSYWYVNSYEGVKLWSLLQHSVPAGTLSASDTDTLVTFTATDGYTATDSFTLKQVADPDSFGFYEKNANDNNDGTYEPNENIRQGDDVNTGDKLSVGYPVLVAYGVNKYPYVIDKSLDGFLSGLSNDGGPLRIISGKMNYHHANGSNQAKLLDKIVVGGNTNHYSTHTYHTDADYTALKSSPLKVTIDNGAGTENKEYTVEDLEKLLYGGSLTRTQLKAAKIKDQYEVTKDGNTYSDLYEGIDLNYFLKQVVELQGSQGTITFKSASEELTLDLEDVLSLTNGYNKETGVSGLRPVIAYAKNGAPMVADKESKGYEKSGTLYGITEGEEDSSYTIKNNGGPLEIIFPRASKKADQTMGKLENVTSITIDLNPDKYAHIKKPYKSLAKNTLAISGQGTRLTEVKKFTVSELEGKQPLATTRDYSIRDKKGKVKQIRYRGLNLYEFLKSTDVGLKNNANKIKIYSKGKKKPLVISLSELRASYMNSKTKAKDLPVLLAYGSSSVKKKNLSDGKPLVKAKKKKKGYKAKYQNSGGPLKLVIGQKKAKTKNARLCPNNVYKIVVTAGESTSWNHSSQEVFKQYLKYSIDFKVVNNENEEVKSKTLTVADLENMTDLISQETISATGTNVWEGVNFWQLIQREFAGIDGITDPTTITVKAKDNYSIDAVEKAGLDGLKNGIKDGTSYVPVLMAYAVDGYPLVSGGKSDTVFGEGYDSTIDNRGGPIRLMVHNAQGACLMEVVSVTIKVSGDGHEADIPPQVEFTTYDGTSEKGDLPMAGIRATAMDKDNNLWVGTYGGGAAMKKKGEETFTVWNSTSSPALESTFVSSLCPDKEGVWMTQNASYTDPTQNRGVIYMKDGKIEKTFRAPETVPNDYVQEIKVDSHGMVWFGSFGGLTRYDPEAGKWDTWDKEDGFPAESVDNIEFDSNGGIWCGFYPDSEEGDGSTPFIGGFAYFKDDKVQKAYKYTSPKDANTDNYRLGDVWVRDIAVDKNGGAWIVASGSYAGMANVGGTVYYVSNPGGKAVKYTGFDLLGKDYFDGATNSELRMVTVDPNGGLWFGSSADGIFYIADPTIKDGSLEVTAQYATTTGSWSGKNYDNVYSLDFYGNTLYSGTSAGLAVHEFDF